MDGPSPKLAGRAYASLDGLTVEKAAIAKV
jgi:hypothetical protein